MRQVTRKTMAITTAFFEGKMAERVWWEHELSRGMHPSLILLDALMQIKADPQTSVRIADCAIETYFRNSMMGDIFRKRINKNKEAACPVKVKRRRSSQTR